MQATHEEMLVFACSCTSSPLGLTVKILFKDTPTCLYEYTSYICKNKVFIRERAHSKCTQFLIQYYRIFMNSGSLLQVVLTKNTTRCETIQSGDFPGHHLLLHHLLKNWIEGTIHMSPAICHPLLSSLDPYSQGWFSKNMEIFPKKVSTSSYRLTNGEISRKCE